MPHRAPTWRRRASTDSTWSTLCPPTSWPWWPGTCSQQTSAPGTATASASCCRHPGLGPWGDAAPVRPCGLCQTPHWGPALPLPYCHGPVPALPGSSPPTCPRPGSPSCALFQPGPLPGTHRSLTLPEAHAGRFLPLKTKGTKQPLSVWLCPCHRRAYLRLSTEVAWQAGARPAGPDKAWVVFEPRSRGRAWWVSGAGEP